MVEGFMFVLGAAMGSFLGAFVWRIKDGLEIISRPKVNKSRSMCEKCHHTLGVLDLIPILSWLLLRGKCRYCKHKIHWQHPLVEFISGLSFMLSWIYWPYELSGFEPWLVFVLWLIFLVGLIALSVYDIKHLQIANRIIYPMILITLLWRFSEAIFFDAGAEAMKEMTLGLLVGGGLFFLLFYISKEKWIGGGDVKLGFFFGMWLGPAKALVALLIGFYSAFLIIIPLLLSKRISRKQPVPFGPFLILGVYIATIWGQSIIDWYQRTLL